MKRMKRILTGLLAVIMLVAATPAIAAPSYIGEDEIIGLSQDEIIDLLIKLDIITGYEDGLFHGERTVTRAEMAVIMVKTLKLDASVVTEIFNDVSTEHWANEYIARAYTENIIVGDGNGLFRPEDPVSYAEAYTMFVNVLNYQPNKNLTWPTNYTTVARANGIADGILANDKAAATRNDIATIVWNALNTEVMMPYTIGDITTYISSEKTLLENRYKDVNYLEDVKFNGYKMTSKKTDEEFEIKISLKDKKAKDYIYEGNNFYKIPKGTLVNALVIDNEIVSLTLSEDNEILSGNAVEINAEKIDGLGKIDSQNYSYVTIDEDEDYVADIQIDEVAAAKVIEKVNFKKAVKKVNYIDGTSLSIDEKNLHECLFLIDGVRSTIEDLEVGDVVISITNKIYEVSRNSVEGTFEEFTSEKVAKGYVYDTVKVDDVEYRYTDSTKWYNEDYKEIDRKNFEEGAEVTVYLTNNNEVAAVVATDMPETYGIIENIKGGVIYLANGEEYDYSKKNGAKSGDFIIFHLVKGEIVVDEVFSMEVAENLNTVITEVNRDNVEINGQYKLTATEMKMNLEYNDYEIYLIDADAKDREFDDVEKIDEDDYTPSLFEKDDRVYEDEAKELIIVVRGL